MRTLRCFFVGLLFLFIATNTIAKKDHSVDETEINRFYDSLMQLVSYDKFRDFYDSYIEKSEISYEDFSKELKSRGVIIAGGYGSRLVGWQRKGKKIILTIESEVKNEGIKRLHLTLEEKKEGLKIRINELLKICKQKPKKRSTK